ncbi:hypothetical protein [Streptomyces sp. NPDC057438]|uniref:hypothetical protein n=1 Tax=Streptomyces sp. NPDC057438 TaxID=3346133 RepID=UPI0036B08054
MSDRADVGADRHRQHGRIGPAPAADPLGPLDVPAKNVGMAAVGGIADTDGAG